MKDEQIMDILNRQLEIINQHTVLLNSIIDRMNRMETELKTEIANTKVELRQEMADMKAELKGDIEDAKVELRQEMADMKAELKGDIEDAKAELRQEMADMKAELKADILLSDEVNQEKLNFTFDKVKSIQKYLKMS